MNMKESSLMKKTNYARRFSGMVIATFLVLSISGCSGILVPLPYRSLAPFEGKVIDTATKEPIEGAVVLGVYYFTTYTIVAGSNSYVEDGQETVTDENGEFELPRTRRWFVRRRGYPDGKLVIFKPGYGVFPRHEKSVAVGFNKGWPPPGKYVVYELPKLHTTDEREKNLPNSYSEIPIDYKKIYIRLINLERTTLGAETLFSEPNEEQ